MADDELLDVLDAEGRPVGVKPRGAVHRDGDRHAAFHLWVVSRAGVLLQRRAATKASWPGCLDATAAGHLVAGERVRDGLREVEEELGVVYPFSALVALGIHEIDEPRAGGGRNRERQHVYAVADERPLAAWTGFDREEVAGLVLVDHAGFARLARRADGPVPGRAFDGHRERLVTVESREVVPAPYLNALAPRLASLA